MKKVIKNICVFALAIASSKVAAAQTPTLPPADATAIKNIVDLKELVEKNNIKNIDALMPLLPPQMLRNPLLVYESHALNTYLVTPSTPRILLFSPDSSFVMSISRDPGIDKIYNGEDVVEFIQLNATTKKFEMGKISFDGVQNPFDKKIELNPKLCLSCHGSNPRPMFDSYNAWPGFYGSFATNGLAVKGSQEHTNLSQLLQDHKDNKLGPRYQALDLSGYDTQTNVNGIMTVSRGFGDLPTQAKMSINMMYGVNLEARMWDRLGQKLVKDSRFKKISPLLYYLGEESNRCGNPRDRVVNVATAWLSLPGNKAESEALLEKINAQIDKDQTEAQAIVARNNGVNGAIATNIDELGLAAIPYSNKHGLHRKSQPLTFLEKQADGTEIERPFIDNENFQNMLLIMESLFKNLNYSSEDITTRPTRPTNGIFHLKRLGRLFKDEQFFQNIFGGIVAASPEFKTQMDGVSCENLLSMSQKMMRKIPVADATKHGILYR